MGRRTDSVLEVHASHCLKIKYLDLRPNVPAKQAFFRMCLPDNLSDCADCRGLIMTNIEYGIRKILFSFGYMNDFLKIIKGYSYNMSNVISLWLRLNSILTLWRVWPYADFCFSQKVVSLWMCMLKPSIQLISLVSLLQSICHKLHILYPIHCETDLHDD